MKNRIVTWVRLSLLLAAVLNTLLLIGCKGPEVENDSARPWNSPKSWETGGLPSGINEGR